MGNYLHRFSTDTEFNSAYSGSGYHAPWASYTEESERVNYNKSKYYEPFTIIFEESGTFTFKSPGKNEYVNLVIYKLNDGDWSETPSPMINLTVNSGDTVQIKATDVIRSWYSPITFTNSNNSDGMFSVRGNIMSILYGEGYETAKNFKMGSFDNNYVTCGSFFERYTDGGVVDAGDLLLPVTALTDNCYTNMFSGCTALTVAPELPATTLATSCYANMFAGCTSLTTAPELPATTMATDCYYWMFFGCTGLTSAPTVLPATTLETECYASMFYSCTSLENAPELPAPVLVEYCYEFMFRNCPNIHYIKCLATDIQATGCTNSWVEYLTSTGTFVKDASMNDWTTGTSGIPTGWTVQNA